MRGRLGVSRSTAFLVAVVGIVLALVPTGRPSRIAQAAPVIPPDEVVALVIEGVGNGHGRGLSQWGAYGWAVNNGWGWQQILEHYYGGTVAGTASTGARVRVRLVAHDGSARVGVISTNGTALWNGVGYDALQAVETGPNRYDVYAASDVTCPSSGTWVLLSAGVVGPIRFATSTDEQTGAAGNVLGLCRADGSIVHYRGMIDVVKDSAGSTRVVNDVGVESYLRGVITREVSTAWGDAGGGAGMNALRAQAVAARSYALAQDRYAGSGSYATTCDTSACQAYGGAAGRATATSPTTSGGVCESGNATYECVNTNAAVRDTAGAVRRWPSGSLVATEFSASNGPRTAGGAFPAVDDPADDVPQNPNHRWTRVLDAHQVAAYWALGPLAVATTEPDPSTNFDGIWDNRVRLVGVDGTQVVGSWDFRGAFGLPSPGFAVRAVTRDMITSRTLALVGNSVGLSVTETSTSELPALLDGVFGATSFDAVQNRCTSGCSLSGVAAAENVPVGADFVLVELGYNDSTSDFGARIDAMMRALQARSVGRVAWVNLSERSGRTGYAGANQALWSARSRWPQLEVWDWNGWSAGNAHNQDRWFASDGIHLTATGQAELALFLRGQALASFGAVPDGRDDVVAVHRASGQTFAARSTGAGFAPAGYVWLSGWAQGSFEMLLADMDADGQGDLVARHVPTGDWYVALGSGRSFNPSGFVWMRSWGWGTGFDVLAGDVTGDGRDDVVAVDRSTGVTYAARSTGAGLAPEPVWLTGWAQGSFEMLLADVNADGRDDLVARHVPTGDWYVALSNGRWFTPSNFVWMRSWAWGNEFDVLAGDVAS